ncbi:DUF2490 domain-containing protein [Aureispira anguillae]|uniref:DUF2490 domain-containing protein n=1 Tax=Aureispira anguillae TaxID=2864201 RepID=A0A915YGP4_9BACT|nr:DUF2490 domain-containing protein [Aureispira anguillae]BDS12827.1 DUF2490 domain-containing protein [Aureispira anguillae]
MKKLENQVRPSTFLFLLLFMVFGYPESKAQTLGTSVVTSDLEGWFFAGIRLKIHKKWTIELKEEFRFKKNISELDQYFTNLDVKYAPIKFLQLGAGFRFTQMEEGEGTYSPHYRLHFDVAYRHKISRLSFKYRLRYQFRDEIGKTTTEGDYLKHRFRLRAGVGYNIKKIPLEPQLSVELFNQLEKYQLPVFDKLRFTASLAYDFKKFGKVKLFYRVEQELFVNYPKTTGVLGLGYIYTIKIKKKDKYEK